jgi:hypothetical protein
VLKAAGLPEARGPRVQAELWRRKGDGHVFY